MKNTTLKIIVCALLVQFNILAKAQSFPFEKANPWKDDYRNISDMEYYKSWGTYNVHDPSCKKFGDTYYMYSTDAIYRENREEALNKNVPIGFIQVRTSKDLVHWNFEGWAFPEIPEEAVQWVHEHANGQGATNIWAPYILKYKDKYRLYYCVSAFGRQTSYIGFAESDSPLGPWEQKGATVKTREGDPMNAIDQTIVTDPSNGKMWMHYGSYFGGLYAVELNPETGKTMKYDDLGHSIARRANMKKDNIEAPEIIYNPELKKYFLFMSYDPLMTTYNIRVGRADKPEGPFLDFFGNNLRDTINHFPILTHPYRFDNHPGWAGTGHCSVFQDEKGNFFMAHQSRLSPENHLMDLHVREIKWTKSGWPVVSPERYAGNCSTKAITRKQIAGNWEVIRVYESKHERKLEAGQILWGENLLQSGEADLSVKIKLDINGKISGKLSGVWNYKEKTLSLKVGNEIISDLIVYQGQDWENQKETLLFTGIDSKGRSVWGKKVSVLD